MKHAHISLRQLIRATTALGGSAATPTTNLDAAWGQGYTQPDDFVAIVYSTL